VALTVGRWPEQFTRKGHTIPEWYPVYRALQIHPGWSVDDYWDAPGLYTDWALEIAKVEAEVREAAQKAAEERARR
jgi:hypothetical protein